MHDNAKPHRAYAVDERLESEDVDQIDWPACCLILSNGTIWGYFGKRPFYTSTTTGNLVEK